MQANPQVRSSSFAWGGCSDDTTFAVKFARDFLDKFEYEQFRKTNDTRYLMNVHNNFVGREVNFLYRFINKHLGYHTKYAKTVPMSWCKWFM